MIIFLYGSDSYRLKQAKDEIVKRYKDKYPSGFNLFSLDASNISSLDILEEAVKSLSFLGEHKLISLKNIFLKKPQADAILGYINKYNLEVAKDMTLLIAEDSSDKNLSIKHQELFKLLSSKSSLVKNIELLSDVDLEEWAKQEFKSRNCVIDVTNLNRLLDIVGNDTWRLNNEIEKLANYRISEKITGADIDSLVNGDIDMNIFDLIDAIAQKNKSNATKMLYREMKNGRDPYYVLTMITYQFRNLLMIKDLASRGLNQDEIIKKIGLHPFVTKKALKSSYQFEEAVKIYNQLLALDIGFKNGQINLEDSLYRLLIS